MVNLYKRSIFVIMETHFAIKTQVTQQPNCTEHNCYACGCNNNAIMQKQLFTNQPFSFLFVLWIQVQTYGMSVGMGQNISHPMAFRAPKTLQKPYVCNMTNYGGSGTCGRTFKYRFNLYKHQRSRHGAPHQLKPRTHGPGSTFYNDWADRPR